LQVAAQAARLEEVLATCQSMQRKYETVEGWAHGVNGRLKHLEETMQNAFGWLTAEVKKNAEMIASKNDDQATIQRLEEEVEKYKQNAQKSDERFQQVQKDILEAK
jgi:chromosome segregation ATPase